METPEAKPLVPDYSIETRHLRKSAVTSDKIKDGTIVAADLDATFLAAAKVQAYAPGSFSIPTESYVVMGGALKLTGTQSMQIKGTGALYVTGSSA